MAELNMSGAKLCRICCELRKKGVEIPDFRKRGVIDLDKARHWRFWGFTLKTLAKHFGVSIPTVRAALLKK